MVPNTWDTTLCPNAGKLKVHKYLFVYLLKTKHHLYIYNRCKVGLLYITSGTKIAETLTIKGYYHEVVLEIEFEDLYHTRL